MAGFRKTRRKKWWAGAILLIVAAAATAAVLGNAAHPPDRPPQTVLATELQLAQGKLLARLSDCAACHQADGGEAYAGGKPLKTPFGTIYGSNITSDPDHGIGRWTADEFYAALTRGKAPDGRNLFPAMPYTSYHGMSREDADLIYAYLLNTPPSRREDRDPDFPFPFNLRIFMAGWNLLFFDTAPLPVASVGSSPAWLRGRYLVNVLGHCGECHTPRGKLGELQRDKWLQGYAIEGLMAPALTPESLRARGWDAVSLQRFMRTGLAHGAVAGGEMYTVVSLSARHLSDDDLAAVTTFLLGDAAAPAERLPPSPPDGARYLSSGGSLYRGVCAGCHGADGQGRPNSMPALNGSTTLLLADPRNLILSILNGYPGRPPSDPAAVGPMPGFADQLDNQQIADIAGYLRSRWGGQADPVGADAVKALRDGG